MTASQKFLKRFRLRLLYYIINSCLQKKAAPPQTNNNIAAPKQIKTAESAPETITDSIPLEISPEDIEFGEFLGEGVYSEVYKGIITLIIQWIVTPS